ncbi:histidinol-phosphate transaminase [Scheffersomyces spartinae]|uniref:histidinol-phosphate transaminase n=1 Tax=Scheffersomyces spartinae TaxID=45513 RepID=A0A9P8AIR7_9ASCO|nr:histidinol-phosphate transaminase [Scheffersomyces spartinae]KAG7193965.1 histidinol-phosphate transaminase [Scheffersomyces spartinae]
MFDLKTLIRPNILKLEPYRCARDDFKEGILLDANENTIGPAVADLSPEEDELLLNRYPDPHQVELKQQIVDFRNSEALSELKNFETDKLTPDNLCLGVGSDESIDLLLRCVCVPGKDKVLLCPPTYGMYSICATVNEVEIVKVPLTTPDFQVDNTKVLEAVTADPNIKVLYITSPGNPTGKLVAIETILDLVEKCKANWNGVIVVDEAYIDFAALDQNGKSKSLSVLVNQYPNLVVLQTLSKSFGLAGIRLGVTYANTTLIRYLNAMRYPYNISSLTANVAIRASNKEGLSTMKEYCSRIIEQRASVLEKLQAFKGVGKNLGGLDANFILVEFLDKEGKPSNDVAKKVYQILAVDNGVVVRFRGSELNCTGGLRISIGTPEENKTLLEKLDKVLQQVNGFN